MTRIIAYPLTSLAVFAMWLMLAGTYSTASFVFAAMLALLIPPLLRRLDTQPVRLRRPVAIVKLSGIVLYDIVRSNIAVARIIMGGKKAKYTAGFINVPLVMTNPYGLAVLGVVLTCTPGTLWVQYNPRRKRLLLHVLDNVDEEEWGNLIRNRYERLLMEIFE